METTRTTTGVTVTATAVDEVRRYIDENGAGENAGLRVGVLPGGCSGFQYGLNIEDEPAEDDLILDSNGLRLFVDPFSLQYLQGSIKVLHTLTPLGVVMAGDGDFDPYKD